MEWVVPHLCRACKTEHGAPFPEVFVIALDASQLIHVLFTKVMPAEISLCMTSALAILPTACWWGSAWGPLTHFWSTPPPTHTSATCPHHRVGQTPRQRNVRPLLSADVDSAGSFFFHFLILFIFHFFHFFIVFIFFIFFIFSFFHFFHFFHFFIFFSFFADAGVPKTMTAVTQ